jgi:putative transposase
VSAEQVRALTVNLLAEMFPLGVIGYRYTDVDIFNLLVAAGAEQRSLDSAARRFTTAPSANLVRHYLDRRLFAQLEIGELEARANALLAERLPPDLTRHPVRAAVDLTLLPYYGAPAEEPEELRRGPAKAGTTRFHAYATAYVVRAGRRLTLALAFVYADDALLDVVEELLARLATLGVRVRRLLLDREFASVAVLRFLQAQPFTAIVALPKRGGVLKAQLCGRGSFRSTYTMRSAEDGELTFPLWVAVRYAMGRRGKHEREYLAFAVVGQAACDLTVRQVAQEYRGRFGIESSYRLLGQGLAPTSSRDPWLRLLLVTVGLLLTNLWVWLKATLLAATPRRERTAARAWLEHSFRLDRLRDLLIEALKACYHVPTTLAYPFHLSPSFTLDGGQIGKY